jgi:hypothetical protein
MSGRAARWLLAVYLAACAVALTWPGVVPFNRVHPLVLGLPLPLAWSTFWLVLGFVVFVVVHRALGRDRRRAANATADGPAGPREV